MGEFDAWSRRLLRLILRPETCLTVTGILGFLWIAAILVWTAPSAAHEVQSPIFGPYGPPPGQFASSGPLSQPQAGPEYIQFGNGQQPFPGGSGPSAGAGPFMQAGYAAGPTGQAGYGYAQVNFQPNFVSSQLSAIQAQLQTMDQRLSEMSSIGQSPQASELGPPPTQSISQASFDMLSNSIANAFATVESRLKATLPAASSQVVQGSTDAGYARFSQNADNTQPPWRSELNEVKKSLERFSHQADDRFASLMSVGRNQPRNLVGGSVTPDPGHACRSPPCSRDERSCRENGNCCKDLMYEMLVDFSEFLKRKNVTYVLTEGTLLGAVRDQDIIPYTADVDLFLPREGWEKAKLINEEPRGKKSYYFMQDPSEPHCARLCAVWEGLPVNREPFNEHFEWDTEQLGNDLAYYMDIYDEEMDFAQAMNHLIFPLTNVTIRNQSFPAPREQELYVAARYGPSWRTPDHQSRELMGKYPSLEQGKAWSKNMLMLQKAKKDVQLGYRLLERATVDIATGNVVIQGSGSQQKPRQAAKSVILTGFKLGPNRTVTNGTATIIPPDENEQEIMNYVLYWAKEEMSYNYDPVIKRLDSGIALANGNQDNMRHEVRPIGMVSRCLTAADPFKVCSTFGVMLEAKIPFKVAVPADATHLAVVAENEAGESDDTTAVELEGEGDPAEAEAQTFTKRLLLGLVSGFARDSTVSETCVHSGALLRKEGFERVVATMILKTQAGIREALRMLADWIKPILERLKYCKLDGSSLKDQLESALHNLQDGKVDYTPGKILQVNGESIFYEVNGAIGDFRKGKSGGFGHELGKLLRPLLVKSLNDTSESTSSPSSNLVASTKTPAALNASLPSSSWPGLRGVLQRKVPTRDPQ